MFRTLDADTADELWRKAAEWFSADGPAIRHLSRAGDTTEISNAALTLNDPRQRWVASRTPAMNPAFAIAEVVWIIGGRNDSAMLNYFNPILPRYAGKGETYHGAYGHRLRHHLGFDQIDRAYKILSANAATRQVALQIWDSRVDLPHECGEPTSKDTPCNVVSLLKVRNGKLDWTQIMRSNDLFRGFPHNVIQFTSLQEVLAGWLGIEVGAYHHYSDSLHLYAGDGDVFARLAQCTLPPNTDSFAVSRHESDASFQKLNELCDFLSLAETTSEKIVNSVEGGVLPPAFNNLAVILAADALRRRNAIREMTSVLKGCTNRCLSMMFERWLAKPL